VRYGDQQELGLLLREVVPWRGQALATTLAFEIAELFGPRNEVDV